MIQKSIPKNGEGLFMIKFNSCIYSLFTQSGKAINSGHLRPLLQERGIYSAKVLGIAQRSAE
jgi:hypothetical protein